MFFCKEPRGEVQLNGNSAVLIFLQQQQTVPHTICWTTDCTACSYDGIGLSHDRQAVHYQYFIHEKLTADAERRSQFYLTNTHTHRGNWMQNRTKGRTQTRGCGGQIDNLASLKIDIVWIFSLGQVWWKLLKACAKTGGILAGAIIEIIPVMLAPLIGWCAQKRPGWLVPYFDSAGSLKPFIHKVEKAGKRFDNYSMWRGLVKHTDINRPFTVLLFISSRLLLSFMKKWRDRYQDVPTLGNCEIKEQRLQHVFKGLWQLFFFKGIIVQHLQTF